MSPLRSRAIAEEIERAYHQGLADGRDDERLTIQAERSLAAYRTAMLEGHAAFSSGDYGLSARQFLLAATLNQGDPASRLCAAHAQIALGEYVPAVRLLHRAFELQPKIAYLPLDLRGAYGIAGDFARHREALHAAAARASENGDLWFLLGYVHFFTGKMPSAALALGKAAALEPEDPLIAELATLAQMSAPPSSEEESRE